MFLRSADDAKIDEIECGKEALAVNRKDVLRGIVIGMLIVFYGFLVFLMVL